MKALVTGASGFVGSNLVRTLLKGGFQVRSLVRGKSTFTTDEYRGELVEGDVRDIGSVKRAIQGCDVVFHVAALYTFWARDPNLIYQVNVQGTKNVLMASLDAGVERVVYTSTVSTVAPQAPGEVSSEEDHPKPKHLVGPYKRSKYQAEVEAFKLCQKGLPLVVVNPTTPMGWGDVKPTPTGKMVLDFIRGRIPAYVDTGLNVVDVEDVAQGHILALRKGRIGQRYILGNRNMTLKEILSTLAAIVGRRPPKVKLPHWLALMAAYADGMIEGKILRREPRIPLEGTKAARHPIYVDCSKAVNEIGLPQTPVDQAMEKAVRWFNEKGYK